jgi:transposase
MTYTRREAAKELGVSHHSIYRWTKRGHIKPPKRIDQSTAQDARPLSPAHGWSCQCDGLS